MPLRTSGARGVDTEAATEDEGSKRQKTGPGLIVADETQKRGADEDPEESARRTRAKTKTRFDERSGRRESVETEDGADQHKIEDKNQVR